MTDPIERCPVCDQLPSQCVCAKPNLSLAEWLAYGRGRGWISPIYCDTHNGMFMTESETAAFDAGEDPCLFTIRFLLDGEPINLNPTRTSAS